MAHINLASQRTMFMDKTNKFHRLVGTVTCSADDVLDLPGQVLACSIYGSDGALVDRTISTRFVTVGTGPSAEVCDVDVTYI